MGSRRGDVEPKTGTSHGALMHLCSDSLITPALGMVPSTSAQDPKAMMWLLPAQKANPKC